MIPVVEIKSSVLRSAIPIAEVKYPRQLPLLEGPKAKRHYFHAANPAATFIDSYMGANGYSSFICKLYGLACWLGLPKGKNNVYRPIEWAPWIGSYYMPMDESLRKELYDKEIEKEPKTEEFAKFYKEAELALRKKKWQQDTKNKYFEETQSARPKIKAGLETEYKAYITEMLAIRARGDGTYETLLEATYPLKKDDVDEIGKAYYFPYEEREGPMSLLTWEAELLWKGTVTRDGTIRTATKKTKQDEVKAKEKLLYEQIQVDQTDIHGCRQALWASQYSISNINFAKPPKATAKDRPEDYYFTSYRKDSKSSYSFLEINYRLRMMWTMLNKAAAMMNAINSLPKDLKPSGPNVPINYIDLFFTYFAPRAEKLRLSIAERELGPTRYSPDHEIYEDDDMAILKAYYKISGINKNNPDTWKIEKEGNSAKNPIISRIFPSKIQALLIQNQEVIEKDVLEARTQLDEKKVPYNLLRLLTNKAYDVFKNIQLGMPFNHQRVEEGQAGPTGPISIEVAFILAIQQYGISLPDLIKRRTELEKEAISNLKKNKPAEESKENESPQAQAPATDSGGSTTNPVTTTESMAEPVEERRYRAIKKYLENPISVAPIRVDADILTSKISNIKCDTTVLGDEGKMLHTLVTGHSRNDDHVSTHSVPDTDGIGLHVGIDQFGDINYNDLSNQINPEDKNKLAMGFHMVDVKTAQTVIPQNSGTFPNPRDRYFWLSGQYSPPSVSNRYHEVINQAWLFRDWHDRLLTGTGTESQPQTSKSNERRIMHPHAHMARYTPEAYKKAFLDWNTVFTTAGYFNSENFEQDVFYKDEEYRYTPADNLKIHMYLNGEDTNNPNDRDERDPKQFYNEVY